MGRRGAPRDIVAAPDDGVEALPPGGATSRRRAGDWGSRPHADFASGPSAVALHPHRLTGVSYSLTADAKDIYIDGVDESALADKLRAGVTRSWAAFAADSTTRS